MGAGATLNAVRDPPGDATCEHHGVRPAGYWTVTELITTGLTGTSP